MKHIIGAETARDISTLLAYLEDLGAPTPHANLDLQARKSLPVFLNQTYDVYRASLFGREYALLISKNATRPTPSAIEKHATFAQAILGANVAFVFPTLATFDRKRLVERRVPFIVPGRQTYLPMVLIDFREKAKGGLNAGLEAPGQLSAPAQLLVLYQLQKKKGPGEWSLSLWGRVLGYSRSTLTRVCKELVSAKLAEPIAQGRQVNLRFVQPSRKLWKIARPRLRNPVAQRSRVRIPTGQTPRVYEAGMTALANLTMMAPGRDRVYAMSSESFREHRERRSIIPARHPDEGTLLIECWRYAPEPLSDGQTVDRLSLYLSLQDDPDERVQAALTDLLEGMTW